MKWIMGSIEDFSAAEYKTAYETLSPSRRARIDRLKREDDRKRSLLAELLLKKLLREEGITDQSVESAENGRPYLSNTTRFISLAHSGDKAVAALSKTSIGVDLEKIKPIKSGMTKRVCTKEEEDFVLKGQDFGGEITDRESLKRFFMVWTAKEAYFKAQGTGITELKSVNTLDLQVEFAEKDDFIIALYEERNN